MLHTHYIHIQKYILLNEKVGMQKSIDYSVVLKYIFENNFI